MPDAVDGHRVLVHRFEQRRLGPRGRAVDLVDEDDVGEDRALEELETLIHLVVDARSGHIRREQVGCRLDPLEGPADRLGDRTSEHRLAHARNVLDEEVTACEEGSGGGLDRSTLAPDHFLDVVDQNASGTSRCGAVHR
jgi:hypothetical protein